MLLYTQTVNQTACVVVTQLQSLLAPLITKLVYINRQRTTSVNENETICEFKKFKYRRNASDSKEN